MASLNTLRTLHFQNHPNLKSSYRKRQKLLPTQIHLRHTIICVLCHGRNPSAPTCHRLSNCNLGGMFGWFYSCRFSASATLCELSNDLTVSVIVFLNLIYCSTVVKICQLFFCISVSFLKIFFKTNTPCTAFSCKSSSIGTFFYAHKQLSVPEKVPSGSSQQAPFR